MLKFKLIFVAFYSLLLLSTNLCMVYGTTELSRTFDNHDIKFKYHNSIVDLSAESIPEIGSPSKYQGRIHGIANDHAIILVWFKQPIKVDINEIMEIVLTKLEEYDIDLKLPNIDDFTERRKVQDHDAIYAMYTEPISGFNGTGSIITWYCDSSQRVFIFGLISHDQQYSEELIDAYLGNMNCHAGEANPNLKDVTSFIPSFPILSMLVSISLISIILKKRTQQFKRNIISLGRQWAHTLET